MTDLYYLLFLHVFNFKLVINLSKNMLKYLLLIFIITVYRTMYVER